MKITVINLLTKLFIKFSQLMNNLVCDAAMFQRRTLKKRRHLARSRQAEPAFELSTATLFMERECVQVEYRYTLYEIFNAKEQLYEGVPYGENCKLYH